MRRRAFRGRPEDYTALADALDSGRVVAYDPDDECGAIDTGLDPWPFVETETEALVLALRRAAELAARPRRR